MEDPKKTAKDLIRQATDPRLDNENMRNSLALQAVKIIARYELLGPLESGKRRPVETLVDAVGRATDPDFVETVATRAEKIVSGVERVAGSVGRIANSIGRREEPPKRRRRRYV